MKSIALAGMLVLAGCSGLVKKDGGAPAKPAPQPGKPVPTAPGAPVPVTPAAPIPPPDKGDPVARLNAAVQLMRTKDFQGAETALVSLDADFPKNSGTLTNLGIVYEKTNRRDLALSALGKAVDLNSGNAVAWNWLGIVARESGDRSGAERAYLRAISAKPDYVLPHLNLGILYDTYLSRPDDALAQYRLVQKLMQSAGKEDLRVTAWIAELESKQAARAPAVAPTTSVTPAAAAPKTQPAPAQSDSSIFPVRKQ